MKEHSHNKQIDTPLGMVEPHAQLLKIPPNEQLLYKVITIENLLRSFTGNYLHFNRVDSYKDFPDADSHDGRQLPKDLPVNVSSKFQNAPNFSAADYYDQSRTRTYACCFSLENSNFIWNSYANENPKGKVCVVFEFGKLRAILNKTLKPGNATLEYEGNRCHQIFSINYGIVEYVNWSEHKANTEHLPNPIKYTYLKDKQKFSDEKELRISLSAIGIGQFALNDGSTLQFPPSLQLAFNFKSAISDKAIQQIQNAPESDTDILKSELNKFRIIPNKE